MDGVEFLEWLEDIMDPHLEEKKAAIWPVDDGMMVDFVDKGLFQITITQIAESN